MSEVLLLGTGAADGWPNPFCRCGSCADARERGELRSPTSVLVDGAVLLDCGPETARAASRAGRVLDGVRLILLTHEHPDHCDPSLLLWRSWTSLAERLVVAGPPAALDVWRHWCGPDDPVELREVRPGDALEVDGYAVRALAAHHSPGALLYDVTTPDGTRLLYATDTGTLPAATLDATRDRRYDLVLLEETFGEQGHLGSLHHDLPTFAATVDALRANGALGTTGRVVAIHLGHHNPPVRELASRLAAVGADVLPDLAVLDVVPGSGATVREPATPNRPRRVLVTGGARSGKSAAAEALLTRPLTRDDDGVHDVVYVATAPQYDGDADWDARIAAHRARRPAGWRTHELTDAEELCALLRKATADDVLLVDCMTLWLTRLVDERAAWDDAGARIDVDATVDDLLDAWRTTDAEVVLVTNEVGSGVVPPTASGRYLRDLLGSLNARLAADADAVHLVVAGRVLALPVPQ